MEKNPATLELQVAQAYVELLQAPDNTDDGRSLPLVRHGAFEVRLAKLPQRPQNDAFSFWVELFDRKCETTLDSCRWQDLDKAVAAAEQFISEARQLHGASVRT